MRSEGEVEAEQRKFCEHVLDCILPYQSVLQQLGSTRKVRAGWECPCVKQQQPKEVSL
jgi:hypothetical protein